MFSSALLSAFSEELDELEKEAKYDQKAYYKANRQQILQKQRQYRAQHKAQIQKQQKLYRRQVSHGARRVRKRHHTGQSYRYAGYR